MNALRISRLFVSTVLTVAFALVASATAFAASDYFLKIEGAGSSRTVRIDGSASTFSVENLPAGDYTITLVDQSGGPAPAAGSLEYQVQTAREAGSGMATGRRSAPRDAASGQATGKRQHSPIRVSLTESSPLRAKISIEAGESLTGRIALTATNNNTVRSNRGN